MENFLYGLEVMVVGLSTVFAVLLVLMYAIKGMAFVSERMDIKDKAKAENK